jgi:putative copper resistance protein D
MIQHMVLGMISPVFLALGAPVTLAAHVAHQTTRLARRGAAQPGKVLAFPLVASGCT